MIGSTLVIRSSCSSNQARMHPDVYQPVIAPGRDAYHAQARSFIHDYRSTPALRAITPRIVLARTLSGSDYTIEALLPWSNLDLTPTLGMQIGFNLIVDDLDSAGTRVRLAWHADGSPRARLRLATAAGAPVTVACSANHERFKAERVRVLAPASRAGETVLVAEGGRTQASGVLEAAEGRADASLRLAMPALGHPYQGLAVSISGRPEALLTLPDTDAARIESYLRVPLAVSEYVFAGPSFPEIDLAQPSLVEDLVGGYRITTAFYDAASTPVTTADHPGRYGAVVTIQPVDNAWLTRQERFTLYRTAKPYAWVDHWGKPFDWAGGSRPPIATLPEELGIDPKVLAAQAPVVSGVFAGELMQGFAGRPESAQLLAALSEGSTGDLLAVAACDQAYWYALQRKLGGLAPMTQTEQLPSGYDADPQKRWPLIIFLHGSGSPGTKPDPHRRHALIGALAGKDIPCVLVQPDNLTNEWWSVPWLEDYLRSVLATHRIDQKRIYLAGFSLGGYGTWAWAEAHPEHFAAIAPIAGVGDPALATRLKGLAIRIYHGGRDGAVDIRHAREMAAALQRAGGGGTADGVSGLYGHNPSFAQAVAGNGTPGDDLVSWLLAQPPRP